jgi:hypothetical protein
MTGYPKCRQFVVHSRPPFALELRAGDTVSVTEVCPEGLHRHTWVVGRVVPGGFVPEGFDDSASPLCVPINAISGWVPLGDPELGGHPKHPSLEKPAKPQTHVAQRMFGESAGFVAFYTSLSELRSIIKELEHKIEEISD